mgnify:CR=1 FL=1
MNANTVIGNGCIISVGAIVDHDVETKECCHINAGAVVNAVGRIDSFRKLESGEVARGYESIVAMPVNNDGWGAMKI